MGNRKNKSRSQKRKFIGNRFTERTKPLDVPTVSEQKLKTTSVSFENIPSKDDKMSGNRIFDVEILRTVFNCLCCPSCLSVNLQLTEDSIFGLSSDLVKKKLLNVASVVSKNAMIEAADEVRKLKNTSDVAECGVSVDGTWQRRGHSSLNGCVAVLSIDTGKVLDLEVMSKWCRNCNTSKSSEKKSKHIKKHQCSCNHQGSAGSMEPVGAYRLFERSRETRKLQYVEFYGDGDSKSHLAVKDIYGIDSVRKYECIGHIQKRVGSKLRIIKTKEKGLGGKGKLSDSFIDKIQNYYGIAIRSNIGNLEEMQRAVIAAFYHCCSGKSNPMHGQCPLGSESWCTYQRAQSAGKVFYDKNAGLPKSIINKIKPTYLQLCDQNLLRKCLHGKTQNANEAFNGCLWNVVPKEIFVELQTFSLGSYIAVITFNKGFKGLLSVLEALDIKIGSYTLRGYAAIDQTRIEDSKRHSLPSAKVKRKKFELLKREKLLILKNMKV
ncbi:CCHC-type domain-containing protein [Trichonephila clavipes]|uniref:CCHC-type domain-containing protein n=1 Tax=Trichonephila clavipes TaxID=2585209 RepID=A0A8X6W5J8_TRICX|nr:CCHC-type domain-containing protein [Trichonephila clavipes]